ncbi:MAG: UDP-N-acetylmuramate--L-alanine ligase [Oscillospiraceae bacterium]|nr:UDP-N-acetylmuramate--L-alanine ligase [Oscillospiraceae bacterium]
MIYDIETYLKPGMRAHLVGIGGVSMSPLAEALHGAGLVITGSDIRESEVLDQLRALGIRIAVGHSADNIAGADLIIRTAAAREDNVEIAAARQAGIPVFERAQAWGSIMKNYKNAVCISGTHGKTTTTSMTTHILMAADKDPTVMIGGTLPLLGAGHRVGKGDTIVLESCEYYNSFHSFFPTIAVILNVDADHLDFFGDIENVKRSFRTFAELVPEDGWVIYNHDDKNTVDAMRGIERRILTFGLEEGADVRAERVTLEGKHLRFDVTFRGEQFLHLELQLPGRHNVYNAVAAVSAAIAMGIPADAVEKGLKNFRGAGRRFEFKGCLNGAEIYDDYAHHPGELRALLDAALNMGYKRVITAFQPHTYSRTKTHFDEFVNQLRRADKVLLAEIYAAREKNTEGISSRSLAEAIPGAEYFPTFEEMEARLRELASEGDIILTVGAGDIYKVGEAVAEPVEKA